ncbi:hypothetical protein D9613_009675 [Agrocybe pediades]|uniref:F-box domain-containing protein n=1 Tax=Agrocybe pediades TaxID=84607 RepID=A0A8H4VQQ8_9AGAR|nr:hypothetical protein D9613_009675 [Agrocybe pediades]
MTMYHTIPTDILWCILDELVDPVPGPPAFLINHEGLHPIDTLRSVSQVCTSWRRIVLEAASIWGRLIDVEYLIGQPRHRREEIMARTKDSPLHVCGFLNIKDDAARDFLHTIVSNELQRIAVLILNIRLMDSIDLTLFDPFWQQPAPNLVAFQIIYPYATPFYRGGHADKVLFDNHAPCLRSLSLPYKLYFPPTTSWLSGLTTLCMPSSGSLEWISGVLRRTPRLSVLRLEKPRRGMNRFLSTDDKNDEIDAGGTIAPIDMRTLRELNVYFNSLQKIVALLSAIYLGESVLCKALVRCEDHSDHFLQYNTSITTDGHYNSVVPSLIYDFFQKVLSNGAGDTLRGIYMYLGHAEIDIRVGRQIDGQCRPPDDMSFRFSLTSHTLTSLVPTLIPEIWQLLSDLDMSHTSSLHLRFDCQDAWAAAPSAHLALLSFLSRLPTLHTLILGHEWGSEEAFNLRFIHDSMLPDLHICPSLKTLTLKSWVPGIQQLDEFLSHRQKIGSPIQNLVLPPLDFMRSYRQDYRWLDQFHGLKVVWQVLRSINEYVCGSGSPEVLIFDNPYPF